MQFVKRTTKQMLIKNYEEAIAVEKDLRAIRVIAVDELAKDSKYVGRRSQASVSKAKEKETIDIVILTRTIKTLSNKLAEMK